MVFIIRSVQDKAVGLSAAGIRAEENKDENARDGAAMNWLWVAMGGAIGASLRYGIGLWLFKPQMQFPWPTWWVNILGCLCTGIFFGIQSKISCFAAGSPFIFNGWPIGRLYYLFQFRPGKFSALEAGSHLNGAPVYVFEPVAGPNRFDCRFLSE